MSRWNHVLGALTSAEFLADYWQKKPLLIRAALAGFSSPLRPRDLLDLALGELVASRLILEQGGTHPWELRLAPHEADAFESLPETHWTLLVHEVDRLVPAVARLLDGFRFLPHWRLDDVMVSCAARHGTVGAHLDHYDVFLLQGLGRRHWSIESTPRPVGEASVPDLDVRILEEFHPDQEWVLEPGDMLYLPPRFAHHGVALDSCVTYSIGFRAPHQKELAIACGADLGRRADAALRYSDVGLSPRAAPDEIDRATLERVRAMLRQIDQGDDALAGWFGCFATKPKRVRGETEGDPSWPGERIVTALGKGARLTRSAGARFAYYRHAGGDVSLFVGGERYRLSASQEQFGALIRGHALLDHKALERWITDARLLEWIVQWVDRGHLALDIAACDEGIE